MKKIYLFVLFLLFLSHPLRAFAADAHFTFSSTTPQGVKAFSNYFYTIDGLPPTFNYQGLKGTITLTSAIGDDHLAGPAPVLVQIGYYPAGTCPASGLWTASTYPARSGIVQSFILGITKPGTVSLPVDIMLPYKFRITDGCISIFYSGGEHIDGTPITISADLSLLYDTDAAPAVKPSFMDSGFEYCIGLSTGCTARALTITPDQAIASYIPISNDSEIKALNGNISYGSLEVPNPPQGPWSASTDFFYVPACTFPPNPNPSANAALKIYGPSADYKDPPAGSVPLFQSTASLNGRSRVMEPVAKEGLSVPVKNGGCILSIAKFNGNGGMHNETQLMLELIPSNAVTGDLNADGKVDIFDYNLLVTNFGKTGSNIVGDIDNNGKVDIFDYNQLVANFGK